MEIPTEYHFDDIVNFAARLCHAPMAAISLVAADRFQLKAKIGLDVNEMSRDGAFCNEVVATQGPVVIPNALEDVNFRESPLVGAIGARAYLGHPIKDESGIVVGSLCVIDIRSRMWTDIEREGMSVLAAQVFGSIELRRANEELMRVSQERREIETRLLADRRDDQRRIAAELHDGLGQELAGISLMLRALQSRSGEPGIRLELSSIEQTVLLAMATCRQLAHSQNIIASMDKGLHESVERFLEGVRATTSFKCGLTWSSDAIMEGSASAYHLYRIVQEAVTNAVKHSGGHRIDIDCHVRNGSMILTIDDDGVGLAANQMDNLGVGLNSMRFRAVASGGRLSYVRRNPHGLRVECEVPLNKGDPQTPSFGSGTLT